MLTQELIPDLSTSWWVLVLAGQEVGNLGRKAASSGARGQKTKKSTARLEQEGGEKSAGRALDPLQF
jgi:hypothetical protein